MKISSVILLNTLVENILVENVKIHSEIEFVYNVIHMEKIKLLVVGKNQDLLQLVESMSTYFKFETELFSDLKTAVNCVEKNRNFLYILIFDFENQSETEMDELDRLKKAAMDSPVIFVCSDEQLSILKQEISQGLTQVLLRPINNELAHFYVNRLIANHALVNENKVLMKLTHLQSSEFNADRLIGKSMAISHIRELIEQFSQSKSNVLICGEKGTGKKLISKIIYSSMNKEKTEYLAFDCETFNTIELKNILFEAENDLKTRKYHFNKNLLKAQTNTVVLLDNVHCLNHELQNILLQCMSTQDPLVSSLSKENSVRIIATTWKDLKNYAFNKNLLFKLNMIEIRVSPLRERREDIAELVEYFNYKYATTYLNPPKKFDAETMEFLTNQDWPGNVYELESLIRKIILNSKNSSISLKETIILTAENKLNHGRFDEQFENQKNILSLEEMTNRYIMHVLSLNSGVKEKTARDLKIDRKTLYRRLKDIES